MTTKTNLHREMIAVRRLLNWAIISVILSVAGLMIADSRNNIFHWLYPPLGDFIDYLAQLASFIGPMATFILICKARVKLPDKTEGELQ